MALLQINHKSNAVKTNLVLNISIPDITEEDPRPIHERKVLWLLHGLSADGSAWLRYGNADWVSRELGVIIIMPSGDRSFYVNMDNGQNYFSYLTEELPEWIDARFKFNLNR
ncbi:MAG TPA: alpha/beta hydrolase-fold protein, partial [Anaerolineaceae bacterium]|nr:alpha/beta hydrolase-fold protein [Anaerolineaceae bacterium]